jgi:hypothetical protein
MCRSKQKLGLNRKKKTWYSSQAAIERVKKLRVEYWETIKHIEPENLVFWDETGILRSRGPELMPVRNRGQEYPY